jgi:hypothetical protein
MTGARRRVGHWWRSCGSGHGWSGDLALGHGLDGWMSRRLRCRLCGGGGFCGFVGLVLGGLGMAVVEVLADGVADGVAPGLGAESADVFVLGEMEGLDEGLGEVGQGFGGFGFDVATSDSGEEAGKGGAEIAGGDVVSGEEIGQVGAEFFGDLGLGFFASVVEAEMGMRAGAGSAATAAICEGEKTQGGTSVFMRGRRAFSCMCCSRRTAG